MSANEHENEFFSNLMKVAGFTGIDETETVTVGSEDENVAEVEVDAADKTAAADAAVEPTDTADDAAQALVKFASMGGMTVAEVMAHPEFDKGFTYEMERDPLFHLRMKQLGFSNG